MGIVTGTVPKYVGQPKEQEGNVDVLLGEVLLPSESGLQNGDFTLVKPKLM